MINARKYNFEQEEILKIDDQNDDPHRISQ